MNPTLVYVLVIVMVTLAAGGAAFVFVGGGNARTQKRVASVGQNKATGSAARAAADSNQQRRRNVQQMLKELEKQQAQKKVKLTMRRRIEQAGLSIEPRTFYMLSAIAALVAAAFCMLSGQKLLVVLGAAFVAGAGLPRWFLAFKKSRREKAFTNLFANAIDIIVRSVRSGLPTAEALKVVAREIPDPVGSEFAKLNEGLKVGVGLDQGLQKMYESMPTSEVSFFGIVMTIQQKSGGNLSEALSNLSGVLRDRKRLQGKIKAMSSEAKASAAIIGSLPPRSWASFGCPRQPTSKRCSRRALAISCWRAVRSGCRQASS